MKYKVAALHELRKPFKIEEFDLPEVSGEQVLVKTAGCGLCHSDLHIWLGELAVAPRFPLVLGHEPSGYVAAKGGGVPESIRVGMPVLVNGGYYRRENIYSLRGANQLADLEAQMWAGGIHVGCYAEYFLVPSYRYLVPAEGLEDLDKASVLSDAGLTPYRAFKHAMAILQARQYAEPGDIVVVVGVGGLGIFGAQYVSRLAPHLDLVLADVRDEALEFAGKFARPLALINARRENPLEAIKKTAHDRKVVAVLDFVGSSKTVSTYIKALSPGGVYVLIGLAEPEATIPIFDTVAQEYAVLGSLWGSIGDLYEVAGLAKRGLVDYRGVVTKRWRLDEINEAFMQMEKGAQLGRMVVSFS
ncbi:MAG: alcohol dehydrogenase catalytic domain-containing protein [Thermoproteus sp. AZ2]|uniref:Alcohol dehydrogenase catalytic domain-containing protein n=1 Tax=Thermoproteus sp. AZ2 TaxID=1609232 RepID=A0ACC6V1V2_9CREN